MDPNAQTSFIPKKSLAETGEAPNRGIGFFTLITFIVFLVALIASGAVYIYRKSAESSSQSLEQSLENREKEFDPQSITQLLRFSSRIESAKSALANHIAVSPVLSLLEKTELPSIRFTSMDFNYSGPSNITLSMQGQALDYNSIAYQSSVFGQTNGKMKDVLFSNLNLDQTGHVGFTLTADIDPGLVTYAAALNEKAGQ